MDEKKYSQLYQALLQEVLQFHSGATSAASARGC